MKRFITILAGLLFSGLLVIDGTIDAIASDATQAVAGGGVTVKVFCAMTSEILIHQR